MAEPEQEPVTLKDKLKKMHMPVADINKFLAYIHGERSKEKGKDYQPVTKNTDDELYTMGFKFFGLGLIIDGVNVVITGKNMAMVTFHGYKNKVKAIYPSATFDVQLVREGDTFKVAKESGSVMYTHEFGDVFGNSEIIGAYCVIKIDGNEYFEALNRADYESMKGGSKNPSTWNKWESEFWLKSVIKRACKRHFNDITVEIDKVDNDSFGQAKENKSEDHSEAVKQAVALIATAKTLEELKAIFMSLRSLMSDRQIIEAKEQRKTELTPAEEAPHEDN